MYCTLKKNNITTNHDRSGWGGGLTSTRTLPAMSSILTFSAFNNVTGVWRIALGTCTFYCRAQKTQITCLTLNKCPIHCTPRLHSLNDKLKTYHWTDENLGISHRNPDDHFVLWLCIYWKDQSSLKHSRLNEMRFRPCHTQYRTKFDEFVLKLRWVYMLYLNIISESASN